MATNSEIKDKLEPAVPVFVTTDVAIALSQAISLKRIADILDGTASGISIDQTIFAGHLNVDVRQG